MKKLNVPGQSRFLLPPPFSFFLSLWGSSRGILVVFLKAGALKCACLEFSGCRVRAPAAWSDADLGPSRPSDHHGALGDARVHLGPPGSICHTTVSKRFRQGQLIVFSLFSTLHSPRRSSPTGRPDCKANLSSW